MATIKPHRDIAYLLSDARQKLHMVQRQFGPALGASHRTATRWDSGESRLAEHNFRKLAELLAPLDTALATEAAAHIGETLESLGLAAPHSPARPALQATPPEDLVDVVVCAAAEASDVSPRAMRSVLGVAFRRARQVGLTVEQVEAVLAPPANKTAKKKG
jgi:transcriptional regulator with XRE-family HTH domain